MREIFLNPWMKKMAKGYGIEIEHYIYKAEGGNKHNIGN